MLFKSRTVRFPSYDLYAYRHFMSIVKEFIFNLLMAFGLVVSLGCCPAGVFSNFTFIYTKHVR